mgnify:CR=1 FL=1
MNHISNNNNNKEKLVKKKRTHIILYRVQIEKRELEDYKTHADLHLKIKVNHHHRPLIFFSNVRSLYFLNKITLSIQKLFFVEI